MNPATEGRRLAAEFLGTAGLLAAVVGSGITVSAGGAAPAQLFQHAVTVGAALAALIAMFAPVSGAHLNPAVTAAGWYLGDLPAGRAARYVGAQAAGAVAGAVATHLMFGLPAVALAATPRPGPGMAGAEAVATAGLVVVIFALVRTGRPGAVAGAAGAWIGAAILFTASAAFANPAVTVARVLTDTYTGIAPTSLPGFLAGQAAGAAAGALLVRWLYPPAPAPAPAADLARIRLPGGATGGGPRAGAPGRVACSHRPAGGGTGVPGATDSDRRPPGGGRP